MQNRRKKPSKPTEIQILLTTLREIKHAEEGNDKQLELELLRDIRETMLE